MKEMLKFGIHSVEIKPRHLICCKFKWAVYGDYGVSYIQRISKKGCRFFS